MRRMLLLTIDFPPSRGGVARYLLEFASFFSEQTIVVAERERETATFDRTATFELRRMKLLSSVLWPHWIPAFWPVVKLRRRYDVLVVSHILPLGLVARIASRILKKPYMVILHGMDFALARRNGWKQRLTKWILREASVVVTNTDALAREVRGFVTTKQLVTVYPCLSSHLVTQETALDPRNSVQDRPIELLTVARLVPRKGHAHVLDAISILKDRRLDRPLHYTVVGNGPLLASLRAHATALGIGDALVSFLPDADDAELVQCYRHADIFVMPTEHLGRDLEGFGMVYIEAGAFGLPVVASDLPGVNEAVIDQETGVLVPPASAADLADTLEKLIKDEPLRLKLGRAGRDRAFKEFTCEKQLSKLRNLL